MGVAYLVNCKWGKYADYVQENIIDPLSMDSSTADLGDCDGYAAGYTLVWFSIPAQRDFPFYGWERLDRLKPSTLAKYANEFLKTVKDCF